MMKNDEVQCTPTARSHTYVYLPNVLFAKINMRKHLAHTSENL